MAQVRYLTWNGTSFAQADPSTDDVTVNTVTANSLSGQSLSGTAVSAISSFAAGGAVLFNAGYVQNAFRAGELGFVDDPDDTVSNIQAATASVASTTNGTISVPDGEGANFSANDFVIISGTSFDSVFEVASVNTAGDPDVITLKAGLTAATFQFCRQSTDAQGSPAGTVRKVRMSIVRSKSAGGFESASGDNSSTLVFSDMAGGSPSFVDVPFTSDGTISQGDAVFITGTANRVDITDADDLASSRAIGIANVSAGSAGQPISVRVQGIATPVSGGGAFTPGDPVYLSTTSGELTQTAPSASGDVVMEVGIATGTNAVLLQPKAPFVLS